MAQFARDAAVRLGRERAPRFAEDALAMLRTHSWPGNLRELRNVVERAIVLGDGESISPRGLRAAGLPAPREAEPLSGEVERTRVIEALAACGGNQSRAAKRLGVSRNTLIARIRQFGIARPRGA